MASAPPAIGSRIAAVTTTRTEQRVMIEVTAIDSETAAGWYVYGYRQTRRRAGIRQTAIPTLYFVGRA